MIAHPVDPVVNSLGEEAKQHDRFNQQPTAPTADDLNRSLRELRRNLQRAGFARVA